MAEEWSDRRRAFEHMRASHELRRREIEQARMQFEPRMASLRAEMDAAREEFERAIGHGIEALQAARRYHGRFGAWPLRKGRKKPPRFDAGEAAPVEPRPKPKPLVDGAEAPIE
jgi:hypothetical protein